MGLKPLELVGKRALRIPGLLIRAYPYHKTAFFHYLVFHSNTNPILIKATSQAESTLSTGDSVSAFVSSRRASAFFFLSGCSFKSPWSFKYSYKPSERISINASFHLASSSIGI